MTRADLAARLEFYAGQVREIPGVSRRNPHAFVETKLDLASAMLAEAKELRTTAPSKPDLATIRPGTRTIGRREVVVERRRA